MMRRTSWISRALVTLGVVSMPLYLVGGTTLQSLLSVTVIVVMLPAIWAARRIHGFPRGFIALLGTIGALFVVSNVLSSVYEPRRVLPVTTALDIAAITCVVVAMAYVVRRRRGRFSSGDVLDGLVIGLGGWLVAWITLILPFARLDERPQLGFVVNAVYLPMAAVLVTLCAMLVYSAPARRPAVWLLAGGVMLNVVGDVTYALYEVGHTGTWASTLAYALYLPAFTFSAASFVHPTARDLIDQPGHHRPLELPGRVAVTGISLTIPITLVALVAPQSGWDTAVRSTSALAILVLVSVRLATATRSHLRAQERLIEAGRTDSLTGLPNRTALLEKAAAGLDDAWSHGKRPSVYLIDVDRFKNTNDSLGHAAGDEAIRLIARRLVDVADRLGVVVGRPSGDEFIVLDCTTSTTGQALAHAELFHDVFKAPITLDAGVMFLTASIGVSTMAVDRSIEPSELFRQADIAMYRAKDAGRNCLALYHDSMHQRLSQRMAIETALHSALEQREMRLYHQPIVDMVTGRVDGFEALIRWQRSDGNLMSPAEFIPIAEETGIITGIGAWALLEALTQLATWIDDEVVGPTTTVSVNVSARQLADPSFCDIVEEALTRSGVPAHLLWLEVTETMMIDNPELARNTLQRIRSTGVRIALDDFGTGFSSLSLLQQFPLQRIKIDRAFVNGIAVDDKDRSLVRTIIAMGGSMGLDIVAEGVETVQQLKILRELGCDRAQGYLISHPVPAEAMRSTIAALQTLSQWEAFDDVLGDRPDRPTRIHPT